MKWIFLMLSMLLAYTLVTGDTGGASSAISNYQKSFNQDSK